MYQYRSPSSKTGPVWVSDTHWACRRHIPSARFPASVDKCLYGCPVNQPPKPQAERPKLQAERPKPQAERPKPRLVEPQEPVLPEPDLPEEPPEDEAEPTPSWFSLTRMSLDELEEQPISDLRKYARHKLGIVGASKIRGGKPVLLKLIQEARAA